jgi:outer membrane lipoprotein-sorting protein
MPAALGVLAGADPKQGFTATLTTTSGYGDRTTIVVQLDAKQPSAQAKQVYLVVDPADGRVRETVTVDSSGNINHLFFDALDPKADVADADFMVDPKSRELRSYKIVDLDRP